MSQQRTRTTTSDHDLGQPDDPFAEGDGDLRQQAAAYANIAREAREDCQRGADAERELQRRRNRSGQ